jgi:hypothetical protein
LAAHTLKQFAVTSADAAGESAGRQKQGSFGRKSMHNCQGQLAVTLRLAGEGETAMADLHETANPQSKEQISKADLAFVAFVVIITAIPIVLTLTQIYLQNPR